MNQHRYYVQLSISEGFPNALCEAMACGCIPIVSHVASMPFIVADKGLVIKKRNVEELVSAVTRFMESELPHPQEVSDMIYGRFPLAKRSSELLEWVRALQQPAKP
jgi:glycosyltransferase involved in cell wall biosynthesis